jgi:hypothetical protein
MAYQKGKSMNRNPLYIVATGALMLLVISLVFAQTAEPPMVDEQLSQDVTTAQGPPVETPPPAPPAPASPPQPPQAAQPAQPRQPPQPSRPSQPNSPGQYTQFELPQSTNPAPRPGLFAPATAPATIAAPNFLAPPPVIPGTSPTVMVQSGPNAHPVLIPMTAGGMNSPWPVKLDERSAKEWQKFQELEQQAAALARQHRDAAAVEPADLTRLSDLQEKLSEAVRQAFDVRQQLQEGHVQSLKDRLKKVEDQLSQRSAARDRIVSEHVNDLLGVGGGLRWDSNPFGSNPYATAVPVTWPAWNGSAREFQQTPKAAVAGIVTRPPVLAPPPMQTAPSSADLTTEPNSVRSGDSESGSAATIISSGRAPPSGLRNDRLEAAYTDLQAQIRRAPATSREAIAEARENLIAELRLFQFDIQEAELLLQAAESKLREADEINRRAPGSVPPPQLRSLQLEVELAKLRLGRLNSINERYQKLSTQSTDGSSLSPKK